MTRYIKAADSWIGQSLFVPAIAAFCSWSGMSQYRFSRYAWMVAGWIMLHMTGATTSPDFAFYFCLGLAATLAAALLGDWPRQSYGIMRAAILALEGLHVAHHLGLGYGPEALGIGCLTGAILLASEYACTIETVPPRRQDRPIGGSAADPA